MEKLSSHLYKQIFICLEKTDTTQARDLVQLGGRLHIRVGQIYNHCMHHFFGIKLTHYCLIENTYKYLIILIVRWIFAEAQEKYMRQ